VAQRRVAVEAGLARRDRVEHPLAREVLRVATAQLRREPDRLALQFPLGPGQRPAARQERPHEQRAPAPGADRRTDIDRPCHDRHQRGEREHDPAPAEQHRDHRDQHEQVRPRQHRRRQQHACERVAPPRERQQARRQPQRSERLGQQVAGRLDQRPVRGHDRGADEAGQEGTRRRGGEQGTSGRGRSDERRRGGLVARRRAA